MKINLFFSYSRAQENLLAEIVDASMVYHNCWYDNNIAAGAEWWKEILSQIRACDVFVLLLSKQSSESKACLAELEYADKLGKHIIALQVDDLHTSFMPHLLKNNNVTFYRATDKGKEVRLASILKNIADTIEDYRKKWVDPTTVPEPEIPLNEVSEIHSILTTSKSLNIEGQRALLFRIEKLIDKEMDTPENIKNVLNVFIKRDDTTLFIGKKITGILENPPFGKGAPVASPPSSNYVLADVISQLSKHTKDKQIGERLGNAVSNSRNLIGKWQLVKNIQNNQNLPVTINEQIIFNMNGLFQVFQNFMQTTFGNFTHQNEFLTIYFVNGAIDTRAYQCFENELYVVQYINTTPFKISCYRRTN